MPAVSQLPSPTARQPAMQPTPSAKHKRFASLLRLPSSSSRRDKAQDSPSASSPRTITAPTTPTATTTATAPGPNAPSASTSSSYFSTQPGASGSGSGSGTDVRSPGSKRPPASFSGIDNSRGPPVTLITRGNSDYARKIAPVSTPTQHQRQHSGLPTPIAGLQRRGQPADDDEDDKSDTSSTSEATASIPRASKPMLSRQSTVTSVRSSRPMASSRDDDVDMSDAPDPRSAFAARGVKRNVSGTADADLFMKIAADTAPKRALDAAARHDRLRSGIARVNNRHSTPSGSSPVKPTSGYSTPTTSRLAFSSSTDPKKSTSLPRRSTALPTPARRSYQSPLPPPSTQIETQYTRLPELNSKASFTFRKDAELSPSEFLASMRRPSIPDAISTPPKRATTNGYRPSSLNTSFSRKEPRTPQSESRPETSSHYDTESHGSTGPAASVWDELDELKTRIKKIELGGGKTPATSNAAVAEASAERPRTANTSFTTVSSSSPHYQRKPNASPSESTVDAPSSKVHPLLRDALAKAKQHTTQPVYRILESTASEAIALAEMAGSTGMSSGASVYSNAGTADRQPSLASPAMRSSAATASRRPSVQVNGESPRTARDTEDSGSVVSSFSGVSPSRALERIEARRASMLSASTSKRPSSQDTNSTSDAVLASRVQRAGTSFGTSFTRTRRQSNAGSDTEEDEDDTLRAPSRAMTDFRQLRSINTNTSTFAHTTSANSSFESKRHSRTYTSQEPLPELQPSPKFQPTSNVRRPTVTGVPNENSLLFRDSRDSPRRFNFDRQSSPAVEKQTVNGLRERLQLGANRNNINRNSTGTTTDLSRSMSLGRTRMRGASTSEK
ncbi:hypothetical protein E8E13_006477 [Curvularia kusanoi]|uniref:Uncharacterized protein n=1 Tax=Curvularia kusanoi TaxID=90978 RepID=A0A9P4TKU3_CURKU|nr:hypothetical protein E8E13_006477 [Curvularia kusanoi]